MDDETLALLAKDIAAAVARGETGVDLVKLAVGWERERCVKAVEECEWGFQPMTRPGLVAKIVAAIRSRP